MAEEKLMERLERERKSGLTERYQTDGEFWICGCDLEDGMLSNKKCIEQVVTSKARPPL